MTDPLKTVGFLHTAEANRNLFEQLLHDVDPTVRGLHAVNPALLADAAANGLSSSLIARVSGEIARLQEAGCTAVTCTCSTLGPLVEALEIENLPVLRVDRAAADQLMSVSQVQVLVALESAAVAADQLLEQSRVRQASDTRWVIMLVPGAWSRFERGDIEGYHQIIADFVLNCGTASDAIFLAQASMADAASRCGDLPVVTTPLPGIRQLLTQA